jgi:hypothetical protein
MRKPPQGWTPASRAAADKPSIALEPRSSSRLRASPDVSTVGVGGREGIGRLTQVGRIAIPNLAPNAECSAGMLPVEATCRNRTGTMPLIPCGSGRQSAGCTKQELTLHCLSGTA